MIPGSASVEVAPPVDLVRRWIHRRRGTGVAARGPMRIILVLLLAVARVQAGCLEDDGSCTEWIDFGDDRRLLVHRTHPLTSPDSTLERAVVVVHGAESNAGEYFSRIIEAATDDGLVDRTLVVAPRFPHEMAGAGELYWLASSSSGFSWQQGDPSQGPGEGISSFEVLDRLVTTLSDGDLFPGIRVITVVGHSAGGQAVQRYAAGTQLAAGAGGPETVFVIANPSSFLYLDDRRPLPGSSTDFAVPETSCTFDRYKYGLQERNAYMNMLGADALRLGYLGRFVTYLAGEEDDDPEDSNLDTSCRAEWQGPHRYARATAFSNHVEKFYPDNFHRFISVPGVGHSSTAMFSSPEGRSAIFIDEFEIPLTHSSPPAPTGVTVE